jgi:hypothetical protein
MHPGRFAGGWRGFAGAGVVLTRQRGGLAVAGRFASGAARAAVQAALLYLMEQP